MVRSSPTREMQTEDTTFDFLGIIEEEILENKTIPIMRSTSSNRTSDLDTR